MEKNGNHWWPAQGRQPHEIQRPELPERRSGTVKASERCLQELQGDIKGDTGTSGRSQNQHARVNKQ